MITMTQPGGGRLIRPGTGRPARWVPWLGLVAALVLSARLGSPAVGVLVIGFVVATPVERVFRRHRQRIRRPGLRTDVFHALFTGTLLTVFLAVPIILMMVVFHPVLQSGPAAAFGALPAAVQVVAAFLLFEILGYAAHRLMHEVPWLWRFHAVHHSSEHLDWLSAVRGHPMEGLVTGVVAGFPLLLLGVGPATLGVFGALTQVWGLTLHMNLRWRLRWLDGIWATTEFHHWHHSNHPEARNTNYAGFLPVLDRIFGTYHLPKDRRPEVYGIDGAMPAGWLGQMTEPFRRRRQREPVIGPAPTAAAPGGRPPVVRPDASSAPVHLHHDVGPWVPPA